MGPQMIISGEEQAALIFHVLIVRLIPKHYYKTHKKIFEGHQEIEKHNPELTLQYPKMVVSREGHAVNSFSNKVTFRAMTRTFA